MLGWMYMLDWMYTLELMYVLDWMYVLSHVEIPLTSDQVGHVMSFVINL